MDWRTTKFDWNRARAFLVTVEEGSLSAAARQLGMAQPTLGRQVAALEEELGVALFERVGRGLTLTPSGLELVDHVRAMGEAASRMSLAASGKVQSIEGTVSISASEVDAAFRLPKILGQLREIAPGVDVEIVATNTESDLRRREADIAIRNYRPTQPNLVARKIRDIDGRIYATPCYLESIGNPVTPEEFGAADFIGFNRTGEFIAAMTRFGLALTQRNFPIVSESHLVQWSHVRQGLGIGIITADIGDAEPAVVQVLPELDPILVPVWLVAHREVHTSRRVWLVFDLLARELARPYTPRSSGPA
ncbi:LysR family transcriptional regulator [Hoeflea sp. G2-23]|uniref:LysR family transcriptional regulator n=1 Tax=Hoeflea algicola TaxID=2983763 RepID=A0ABT3ZAT5_9HYPH|nr:LysR family transcriptional regulator [Hoeflea algicola]MCY0148895.1 LysR family transcriptional regulator [Hoeflea algicola]